jgi:hypothetical protein
MRRERYAPMHVCDRVPTLRMALDPGLPPWARVLDDDPRFQTVNAEVACRVPRPLRAGRPAPPGEVLVRLLVVQPL